MTAGRWAVSIGDTTAEQAFEVLSGTAADRTPGDTGSPVVFFDDGVEPG
jgi:hypothetical protein